MKYLLDTCVIFEVVKSKPHPNVIRWLQEQNQDELYLSVLTFGELEKGIEKAKNIKRKKELQLWVKNDLKKRFQGNILEIDLNVATEWGLIQAQCEKNGHPLPVIDGLIAVSAIVHDCIIVTRNVTDMEASGVELLNLWE